LLESPLEIFGNKVSVFFGLWPKKLKAKNIQELKNSREKLKVKTKKLSLQNLTYKC